MALATERSVNLACLPWLNPLFSMLSMTTPNQLSEAVSFRIRVPAEGRHAQSIAIKFQYAQITQMRLVCHIVIRSAAGIILMISNMLVDECFECGLRSRYLAL